MSCGTPTQLVPLGDDGRIPGVDTTTVREALSRAWDSEILPNLSGLVEIPALSPAFDAAWQKSGHLDAATEHVRSWLVGRQLHGAEVEIVRLPGRTPLLMMDVPASEGVAAGTGTVILYGHLDKQPPCGEWSAGLGPWSPVLRDGRLYGRGAADDGYSGYAATAAIEAVRASGGRHARCVVLLETSEESGSPDLASYLDYLRALLGEVSLVVCLDSGGYDQKRLWLTTSLRGLVSAVVTVRVLPVGQHSGMVSGVVPSSFRVMRALLDRLENSATGEVLLPEMRVDIPAERIAEIAETVRAVPGAARAAIPTVDGLRLVSDDEVELLLNNSWRPTLSVIGAAGFPRPEDAGNVLRPYSTLSLSFRLPPTADSRAATETLCKAVTTDVPYGAQVTVDYCEAADGWNAPPLAPWLRSTLDAVGESVFGQPWCTVGIGGSIPFMGTLARAYPSAQFLVTGAVDEHSNTHVPDESLDLGHAARVTEVVAMILDAHAGATGVTP
jgi:acetylornithine deacetylase/succinyl-diaminopimelate desuccinylase-like protein